MAAAIDQVSHMLGNLERGLENLDETFKQHLKDDSDRHTENLQALRDINASLDALARKAVPVITPDGGFSRKVIISAASVGFLLLSAAIWAAQKAFEWLAGQIAAHFH